MKKIANCRPIPFVALSLAAGICFVYMGYVYNFIIPIISLIVLALVSFGLYFAYRSTKNLIVVFSVLLAFAIGGLLILRASDIYTGAEVYDSKTLTVFATVDDVVKIDEDLDGVTLSSVTIADRSVSFKIFAFIDADTLERGNRITFTEKLTYNPISASYLESNTPLRVSIHDFKYVFEKTTARYTLFNYVSNIIQSNLSGNEAAICRGIILGDTSLFEESVLHNYRMSGVCHVFAVSGLHVVFFAGLISKLLSLFKLKGLKLSVLTVVFALLYSAVCGFPYSAIRATLMVSALSVCQSLGRKYDGLNSLFLSFIIILLIFPASIFSYGFWLSFLAVIGINTTSSELKSALKFLPKLLSDPLSVSISVSVATTPLLMQMLGYVSIIAVFLNVLIIPMVSFLYALTFFATFITAIIPFMGFMFALPKWVAAFINGIMGLFNFERFLFYGGVSAFALVLYYLLYIVFSNRTNFSKHIKITAGALAFVTLALSVGGII